MSADEDDDTWASGVPEMRPGESRIAFAHLTILDRTSDTPGILFLTNQRLILRAVEDPDSGTFTSPVVIAELDRVRLGWPRGAETREFLIVVRKGRREQAWRLRSRPSSSSVDAHRIFRYLEEVEAPDEDEP